MEEREREVMECCHFLRSASSSSSSWRAACSRLLWLVEGGGSSLVSLLLRLLRHADLPDDDEYQDAIAAAIAQCCDPFSAAPSIRTFTFSPPSIRIQIREMDYSQCGLGWKVWGSALVLAQQLISQKAFIEGKHILELGSGCGLCGLLAAELGASEVVLTDNVPGILLNLQYNIHLLCAQKHSVLCNKLQEKKHENPFQIPGQANHTDSSCSALPPCYTSENDDASILRVCELDWLKESPWMASTEKIKDSSTVRTLTMDKKFDWVIGSDLIYDQTSLPSLAGVIHRYLDGDGHGLFASPIREKSELDFFLKELHALGFCVEVKSVGKQEWDLCRSALSEDDTCSSNQPTFRDIDYYEGGIVVISVRHKAAKRILT